MDCYFQTEKGTSFKLQIPVCQAVEQSKFPRKVATIRLVGIYLFNIGVRVRRLIDLLKR